MASFWTPPRTAGARRSSNEALQARDEGRSPRNLYAWDYLSAVQDFTRQGALRFRHSGTQQFLANEKLPAPPVTSLQELQAVAYQLSSRKLDDLNALRKWLAVLVAPGASLGGARPKANFTDSDGSLWIGKFPAREDDRDVGAWEYLVHGLAAKAGVDVPPARLLKLNNHFHTFCVRRFDRENHENHESREKGSRLFYASAMSLLRKEHSEGSSYLELAQFLRSSGDSAQVGADLEQLFCRVAFNVAVGNRDDHLRNHGFILGTNGWRLAPAFDLNPNIDKADHVLNIDHTDNRPNLQTVLDTAGFYGLGTQRAQQIVEKVCQAVAGWRTAAQQLGMGAADRELMALAFSAMRPTPARRWQGCAVVNAWYTGPDTRFGMVLTRVCWLAGAAGYVAAGWVGLGD